jgi:hypothetical protein
MSLRSQIHDAIDDIATPVPTLERRVKVFVLSDPETRKQLRAHPRSPWNTRFRGTMALVAAAVVVALIGGLILGGRFWRMQNAAPASVSESALKSLESQPLHYPTVAPGTACPTTAPTLNQDFGVMIGQGPIYINDSEVYEQGDWGYWVELAFASADTSKDLVLIRARDLQSGAEIAFAQYPLAPTGITTAGPVLGTARVVNHRVELRTEAVFHNPAHRPLPTGGYTELLVLFGMQTGSSGCIGFQIDGPSYHENFVINPAIP